jgi:integrase
VTVGSIAEAYLRHAEPTLTPNTTAEYRNHCNHQIVPEFGRLRPLQLTHARLEQYRERRSKENATRFRRNGEPIVLPHTIQPSTINRELAFLRAALNHWNETNPDQAFRVPLFPMQREDNTRKGFETEAGFKRIYDQLPYAGLRALAAVSFYTGVRRVELTATDWEHVDFKHSVMTIYRTKGHQPREVPIFSGLMEDSLREAKRERDELYPECAAVFAYEGRRLRDPKRAWHTACKRARRKRD